MPFYFELGFHLPVSVADKLGSLQVFSVVCEVRGARIRMRGSAYEKGKMEEWRAVKE